MKMKTSMAEYYRKLYFGLLIKNLEIKRDLAIANLELAHINHRASRK